MSDMKCPICGQELKNINLVWFCENESCRAYDWTMEEAAWQELIRTSKALDVAVDALDSGRTLARIAGFEMLATGMDEAIEKITALNQGGDNE